MQTLINNRIKYELVFPINNIKMYCSKSESLFRLKYQHFAEKLKNHYKFNDFINWFGDYDRIDIEKQPFIYFNFEALNIKDKFIIELDENYFLNFKKQFIKQTLIDYFINNNFLIDPYPIGNDLSVYCASKNKFNDEWDRFIEYDFIIKLNRNEIIFNETKKNVLISKNLKTQEHFLNIDFDNLNAVDPKSRFIKKVKNMAYIKETNQGFKVLANNDIKKEMNAFMAPAKLSYKNLYEDLKKFYVEYILNLETDFFKILGGGFNFVLDRDKNIVYNNSNQMVFKNEMAGINVATGMRDFGPFKESPVAKDVQFIFIYENADDANKLYKYFKDGLKHFPGLQTYVNISPTLADLSLKYKNQSLKFDVDNFMREKLPNADYAGNNYFVIFIGPFKKNNDDNIEESIDYYNIKKAFLKKDISSQFIYYKNIRSENFHFYLPNIAIAILAKLGGIPWKLKENNYRELIIGFNATKINSEEQYIGSSVFFDNQGYLKKVNSYEKGDIGEVISHLKDSIEYFRMEYPEEELKRIVIHTFKPYGKREKKIEKLLLNELKINVPIIYIEINDTKTTTEICFDEKYNYGMPMSGTFVRIGKNEYLLFNNNRYMENPVRSITEEWPIRLKIYHNENLSFNEKQLISQVYEFSRLYWKSLRQKSQPVTTIYSKLIADYRKNFNESIPINKIAQNTPWFL